MADPQVLDVVGSVRLDGLRRLRSLHRLVPRGHRRARGTAGHRPGRRPDGTRPWPRSPAAGRARRRWRRAPPATDAVRPPSAPSPRRAVDTTTLRLACSEPAILVVLGQFVMVELPAFAPISISRMLPDGLAATVRAGGDVRHHQPAARRGDLPARPDGRGWPVAEAYGRDVVIVAGGMALLRPLIDRILAERPRFGAARLCGRPNTGGRPFRPRDARAGRSRRPAGRRDRRPGRAEWTGRSAWSRSCSIRPPGANPGYMCGPERMTEPRPGEGASAYGRRRPG